MKVAMFSVRNDLFGECSLTLRRFVGGLDGVASIEADQEKIAVTFDEQIIDECNILTIANDSIEKLGYRIDEQ